MPMIEKPDARNGFGAAHAALLLESYRRWTGGNLVEGMRASDCAKSLFFAPFAVVSHNTDDDPVFNYGNLAALKLFEMEWDAFTKLPSRMSAEPVGRAERAAFMARVTRDGCVEDYRGVRISATGRRFVIEKATVWNLVDARNVFRGQAAAIFTWSAIDGSGTVGN